MGLYFCFIASTVLLQPWIGEVKAGHLGVAHTNADAKIALIEKDIEHIKSVLDTILKQTQNTATLSSQILELQQQAGLWKNIAAKQQVIESKQQSIEATLATEIQNVKLRDEKNIQGLKDAVKGILEKDAILENQLQATESTLTAQIQQLKGERCSCRDELRWINSTGGALHQDMLSKQSAFESRITLQLSQLNQTAGECSCNKELSNSKSANVSLYNEMLLKQISYEKRVTLQLDQLNHTANICSCQHDIDLLNSTLSSLYLNLEGKDCADLYEKGAKLSGVYKIVSPSFQRGFDVYCDMETDGGGWTVFQRRKDGSVDFFRRWGEYKNGFGNVDGEYWLGNDRLHQLTVANKYSLRVDLEDWSGVKKYAVYREFSIGNEDDQYRLKCGQYSDGDAGDALAQNRGNQFSTFDRDNDATPGNVASEYNGAWWYYIHSNSNLNGLYYKREHINKYGVFWSTISNSVKSLKLTEMKIRPVGFKVV